MLTIHYKSGKCKQRHIGEPQEQMETIKHIEFITADCDELEQIIRIHPQWISHQGVSRSQTFYGDIARTIMCNL